MKRSIVVHSFLFAAFPILFSLANNMDQFLAGVCLGPLLAMSALVLAALGSRAAQLGKGGIDHLSLPVAVLLI
jgi:hypothetical protein